MGSSAEPLLERVCLMSSLHEARSISNVFTLRRAKRRRTGGAGGMQSESLDYHTVHNRAGPKPATGLRSCGGSEQALFLWWQPDKLLPYLRHAHLRAQACTRSGRSARWRSSGACSGARRARCRACGGVVVTVAPTRGSHRVPGARSATSCRTRSMARQEAWRLGVPYAAPRRSSPLACRGRPAAP